MKRAFAQYFEGTIWKMDIHEAAQLLAIEWRTKEGDPYFSVIHYPSGSLKLEKMSYGDRWWTLATVTSKHLLLQHYPNPSSAQTQALVAINLEEHNIAWERFNIQFQELVKEGLAVNVSTFTNNNISVLDESTGEALLTTNSLNTLSPLQRTIKSPLPTHLTPIVNINDHPIVGPYFLLDEGETSYWAYHEQTQKGLKLMLTILKNNQIHFNLCLEDNLEYLLPEVFFMIGQQLFFIRNNKQEIVSYFV